MSLSHHVALLYLMRERERERGREREREREREGPTKNEARQTESPTRRVEGFGSRLLQCFPISGKVWALPKVDYLVFSPSPLLIQKIPAERTTVQHFFLHVDFSRSCGQLGCGNLLGHSGCHFARSVSMVPAACFLFAGAFCATLGFAVANARSS